MFRSIVVFLVGLLPGLLFAQDQVLLDFERPRDINMWEVGEGSAEQSNEHAVSGGHSLEVAMDSTLATTLLPRDWSAYQMLEIGYHNVFATPVSVGVVIGDMAWLDRKSYWNQYNGFFMLQPGRGTLQIPVQGLFRGTNERRNVDLPGNLDPSSIVRLELEFKGQEGSIFLDRFALRGAGDAVAQPQPQPQPQSQPQPTPPSIPAPVAVGPANEWLWADFEQPLDVAKWERRSGPNLRLVPQHATSGQHTMQLRTGSQIGTFNMPRDWTRFEALYFDIFNAASGAVKLEVQIGDDAWLADPNYWNRFNATYNLNPGPNQVVIPLGVLYRGEPSRRNKGTIQGDLDKRKISFFLMSFNRVARGNLFLDRMRFAAPQGQVIRPAAPNPAPAPAPPVQPAPVPAPQPAPAPQPSPPPSRPPPASESAAKPRASEDRIWTSFEAGSDPGMWEVRFGRALQRSNEHATEGSWSMQQWPGSLIATYAVPRDWSPYSAFEFDVFNPSEHVHKLELLIGDDAWIAEQNYWNRHNKIVMVVPGRSTISIPVDGLYRGEAAGRNRGSVKRNIDADQITFFSIRNLSKRNFGPLHYDHFRLVAGGDDLLAGISASIDPLINDFEQPQDIFQWETREGPPPRQSEEHATSGVRSMALATGNLIASSQLPPRWSEYDALEFDVYNAGSTPVSMELVLGDRAWMNKQDYWNRHNAVMQLSPGPNQISIPVNGLYRGEANARNRDIPTNIDTDHIMFMSLKFSGAPSALYLDHMRLSRTEELGGGAVFLRGFDFGPENQSIYPGFTPITWNTVYEAQRGSGLERAQDRASHAGDTTFPTRLLQDYVWVERGDFLVDVPAGNYTVHVFFEDSGYWGGEQADYQQRAIYAEGHQMTLDDTRDVGGTEHYLYQLEALEPTPGESVLSTYFPKLYAPRSFDVAVTDGQLNLGMFADGKHNTRVAAIVLHEFGNERAQAWVEELMQKNVREATTKAALLPMPKPHEEALPQEPACLLFQPHLEQTVYLNTRPTAAHLDQVDLDLAGTRGEVVPATLALLPRQELGVLDVQCSALLGEGGDIDPGQWRVHAVRHLAKRGFGDASYNIVPWYLAPLATSPLQPERTRQVWFTLHIPEDALPGTYRGSITLSAGSWAQTVPVSLEIDNFVLAEPDISISLFNMPQETLPLFRSYGFTAPNGGPVLVLHGFDNAGAPIMNFSAADAWMRAAREAGYSREALDYNGPLSLQGCAYHGMRAFFMNHGKPRGWSTEETAKKVFDAIKAHAEANDWLPLTFNIVDEPLTERQTQGMVRSARLIKQVAPWLTTIGYYHFSLRGDKLGNDALFRLLDVSICKTYDDEIMRQAEADGHRIYLYSLGRNRFTFGSALYAHRARGVKGYVQWHSFIVHGYQFFDLDGREPDEGLVVRRSDGWYPTLELEWIRMGITDLRYLITLEQLAEQAGARGEAARAFLRGLVDQLPPDRRGPPQGFVSADQRAEARALIRSLH